MKRIRQVFTIMLCSILLMGLFPMAAFGAETSSLSNFKIINTFRDNTFTDVSASAWYFENVKAAYELGLMIGQGKAFGVDSEVTIAETVTLAARIHSIHSGDNAGFTQGTPWYQTYADYITGNHIINLDGFDMSAPTTRAQFAYILGAALPDEALESINNIADNAIPDVKIGDVYAPSIYRLYRAGILTGSDDQGTYLPDSSIKRSEVAAIVTRMAEESRRMRITLGDFCTVTFQLNDKSSTLDETVTVESGKTVSVPTDPTRSGYTFDGWYTDEIGGSRFDFTTRIESDITLYARWTGNGSGDDDSGYDGDDGGDYFEETAYTVTFYMNDGTSAVYTDVAVAEGSSVSEPDEPEREGYAFGGWYTDAAATAAYVFGAEVKGNLDLYAKWIDSATAFYTETGEVLEVIKADESEDVMNETEVQEFLDSKGLGDYVVSFNYSIDGDELEDTLITEGSVIPHPMYKTAYLSENEETWLVYVVNGAVFAYPLSFNLESDLGAELIFSESNTLTSYDSMSNQFFVTIPDTSEMIVKTVKTINAETLDRLTVEEICRLSGAAMPDMLRDEVYGIASAAVHSRAVLDASGAEASLAVSSSADPFIIVSLGDSYSSGEGVEEFYGQELSLAEKVHNYDWLSHRSKESWSGKIYVPGTNGRDRMSNHRVPYGQRGTGNIQWYFAAVSGAQTRNYDYNASDEDTDHGKQKKDYDRRDGGIFGQRYKGTAWVPNQMDVFNYIDDLNDVDYVTLTIGGNDVDFVGVITMCLEPTYLEFGNNYLLEHKLNELWENINSTMMDIRAVYKAIHDKVPNAAILVAGYPELLDKNGKGPVFSKNEATLVNEKVRLFNDKIEELVEACESELNTYFVDVETAFAQDGGHQAYSKDSWITPLDWFMNKEDLGAGLMGKLVSHYSMHPNYCGIQAYADCMNEKIEWLESRKAVQGSDIAGMITIADADTDMTNNLPLEGATVTIELSSYMDIAAVSDADGQYRLRNIPSGTYRLTVTKEGYIPVTEMITVPDDGTDVYYNVAIESISEGYKGTGYASGTVYDVGTGLGVPDLTLGFYFGLGIASGESVLTVQTSYDGSYDTPEGLEAGNYTVVVTDERDGISDMERYATAAFSIKILGGLTIGFQNGYVSNGLISDNIRIVLTWGEIPEDLDSHLVGPTSAGETFHVYYPDKSYGDEVFLDVDDTDSYGPETVTLLCINDGVYTYAVHNYTDRNESSSISLSTSGAQVRVYRGKELLMTYHVPTGSAGTLWTVFAFDSTTQRFTSINEMSYNSSDGETVLMDRLDSDDDGAYNAYVFDDNAILSGLSASSKQP